jgi:deoxyribonuclease V
MLSQTLSPKDAILLQQKLRQQVVLKPPSDFSPKLVAGTDVSYSRKEDIFYAVVVVLELPCLHLRESQVVTGKITFPYIPGLLSFREAPFLIEAIKKLKTRPDVVLVDGQGIAHPRRIGLASHLGVCLDLPTIGCAKSRLIGEYSAVPETPGEFSLLKDKGENIGIVLRTRKGVKPIFVSPGHLMDLKTAYCIVMQCLRGYRLPEPTRLAHLIANRVRKNVDF